MFHIEHSSKSIKFLKRCNSDVRKRIVNKIDILMSDPVPHDAKRLKGSTCFRIRIGDYRVLYEIKWKENIILIVDIDKRERAYHR